jgi:hypothetical protein
MTHRNENSVLFSLGHLQQLAMATSANQATFGPPRPMYQQQPVEPMPVAFGPSAAVLAPRAGWPTWLAPMVIGIGVLFIGFLVLALVVAMRPAEVRNVPAKPTVVAKPALAPAPAPVAAVAQPTPPKPRATATPSALPAKDPSVEKRVADPPAKKKKKLTKSKRKRLAKARLKRRRLRRKRRRARARARRAKRRRAKRIATRSSRSSRYKPFGRLGDRDLDAILNAASR